MTEDGTVYLDDAAAAIGVSRRTLYYWMDQGLLPYRKTPFGRRSRRVKLADAQRIRDTRPLERWEREAEQALVRALR